jgi:CelD/BcsL family acetyltransferase involved in cellulose biosynthesis
VGVEVAHGLSEALGREWDELADRLAAPPFLRHGWFEAWRRAFGRGQLEVLVARRGGELRGVAPFERQGTQIRALANWHTPSFAFLAEPGVEDELAARLLRPAPQQVDLSFVDGGSSTEAAVVEAARATRFRQLVRELERAPFISTEAGWPAYESGLAGGFRRELRRRRRRMEELGDTAVSVEDGSRGLDGLLDEGLLIEAAGWKGERGSAVVSNPATADFYRSIAHWAAERGWLRLCFLRLDGAPVAFDLALEADGVHYLLKTGYDPAMGRLSPGNLLRREMLARAFEVGLDSYEFLGADEPWKLDWTGTSRPRVRLQLFSPSLAGRTRWAAFAHGRPMARRLLRRDRHKRAASAA